MGFVDGCPARSFPGFGSSPPPPPPARQVPPAAPRRRGFIRLAAAQSPAPTVTVVKLVNGLNDGGPYSGGPYEEGAEIWVSVTFSEDVRLSGGQFADRPTITLVIGDRERDAVESGLHGRTEFRFRYKVAAGDSGPVRIKANSLEDKEGNRIFSTGSVRADLMHERVDTVHRVGPVPRVRGLKAEARDGSLAVSWTAEDSPGGYLVRWRVRAPGSSFVAGHRQRTGATYTITGLDNGTTYVVRVDKLDANRNALRGTQSAVAGTPSAGAPSLSYPAVPDTLSVGASVTMMATASGFTGTVAYSVSPDLPAGLTLNGQTGLIGGAPTTENPNPVTVTVTATAGSATATYSIAFPAVGARQPPAAPAMPTLEAAAGQLTVTWTAPADNGSVITDYDVRHRPAMPADEAWTDLDDTGAAAMDTTLTATVTGLTDGTAYQVQVRAQNAVGESEWSASATGTPSSSQPQAQGEFSVSGPASVREDAGKATYQVSLSARPVSDATVNYATADAGSDVVTTAGRDYVAVAGTLIFTPDDWDTPQTVDVEILDDDQPEWDETFSFTLSAPVNATLSTDAASVTTNIPRGVADGNDATRTPVITAFEIISDPGSDGTYGVGEAIQVAVTFSLPVDIGDFVEGTNPPSATKLDLRIGSSTREASFVGREHIDLERYSVAYFSYEVGAGDMDSNGISIPSDPITLGRNHAIADINTARRADLSFGGLGNQEGHKVDGTSTAEALFSVSGPDSVNEGSGVAVYSVTLGAEPAMDATVDYTTGDNSASDLDYEPASGTLTFTTDNWDTPQTVEVTILDEDLPETKESFHFRLRASENAALSPSSSVLTSIVDNDERRAPVINGVSIVSRPMNGDSYGVGETIEVDVAFSLPTYPAEWQGGVALPGISLTLRVGDTDRVAGYSDFDLNDKESESTLRFTYTVQAGDSDMDGVSVPANAIRQKGNFLWAADTLFVADVSHAGLPAQARHKVGAGGQSERPPAHDAPPTKAANLQVVPGDGSLDLLWTPASSAPNGYSVRWRKKGPGHRLSPVNEVDGTFFTITGLENGTTYVVRVDTRNAADDGVRAGTRVTATGTPSPTLSVGDAEGDEGDVLEFAVTLSSVLAREARVRWRTEDDGSARAGEDYEAGDGELVFAPGDTSRTVRVRTLDDAHDDPGETFRVVLSDARGAVLGDDEAVGTILNSDPLPGAWLAHFGRTVAEHALDGVARRLSADRASGARGMLAGMPLERGGARSGERILLSGPPTVPGDRDGALSRPGGRAMTVVEALAASGFALTGERDGSGASMALWARGARSGFDAETGAADLDGTVATAMLGVDYGGGDWLGGVAFAWSDGEGRYSYDDDGEEMSGAMEASLGGVVPYASLRASERLGLWGAAGHGTGTMTLTPEGGTAMKADLDWSMMAAGLRGDLLAPQAARGPALALVSDALWSRTGSARVVATGGTLAASESEVTRLRLGLEGRWSVPLEDGGGFTPRAEAGIRHDGGDAGRGLGVELGGGVAWEAPRLGLSLDLSGRTLLAHRSDGRRERGFSAALGYDADPGSGRGLSLGLRRETGGRSGDGLDALFAAEPLHGRAAGEAADRWSAEAAYGLPAFGGRLTAGPALGLGFARGSRDYSLGWRLVPEAGAAGLSFGVEAKRRERGGAAPGHGVSLELGLRW